MAHFEAIAAGVFEEDGVVVFLVVHGAFKVERSCRAGDGGEAVDFSRVPRVEGDAVLVGAMGRRFGDAEELSTAFVFELEPVLDVLFAGEAEGREELAVEVLYRGERGDAQVDVVVEARHGRIAKREPVIFQDPSP